MNGSLSLENVCLIWLIGPNKNARLEIGKGMSHDFQSIKFSSSYSYHWGALGLETYLAIIIRLPTEKKIQNFLALKRRKGMYMVEIRKHDKPQPNNTAKNINLCVADSLRPVNRSQKFGPVVVTSSLINDLNEYWELNISIV